MKRQKPATITDSNLPQPPCRIHSTRLFPKDHGSSKYVLSGIAERCDWIVLSDQHEPKVSLIKQRHSEPETVFVSLRQPFAALEHFFNHVLPEISNTFVLITGSEDVTIPTQLDHRWRRFNERECQMLERIRLDSRVTAWFAENLDSTAPKMHPLPTGLVPPPAAGSPAIDPDLPDHGCRPLNVLCCHRIRNGDQWRQRRIVTELCKKDKSDLCNIVEKELPLGEFIRTLRQHAFALCVEGGGLDPAPKAWLALMNGTIPIIRKTATAAAYRLLPVAFVDDWCEPFLNRQWLEKQRERLAPAFQEPAEWRRLQEKLQEDFWWRKIRTFVATNEKTNALAMPHDRCILVIGMHRSGTSLLTALIAACGANPGPGRDLTGPNQHNPKGFWENNEFRAVNETLLREQGCEWDSALGFSCENTTPELRESLTAEAKRILNGFHRSGVPILKDPRTCLTLDFWKSCIAHIIPILVIRNPVEVAKSLFRRNQIPVPIGIALWELYVLSSVRACKELQPIICDHQALIHHPHSEVERITGLVNQRNGKILEKPDTQKIMDFVDPTLHRETASDVSMAHYLVQDQQLVWSLLRESRLDTLRDRELSAASRIALEGYDALGMQFSRVRHLQNLHHENKPAYR